MSDRPRQVSAVRTMAATPAAIFAVLADPARHPDIDGSGGLLPAASPSAAPARQPMRAGSTFVTAMRRRPDGFRPAQLLQALVAIAQRGQITNTVIELVAERRIAWRNFGRHVWSYELEPVDTPSGPATRVRETFDYSTNLAPWLLELVGFPARNAIAMTATLARLDNLVTHHHP